MLLLPLLLFATLTVDVNPARVSVAVTGAVDLKACTVRVDGSSTDLLGEWKLGDSLIFTPRFPFEPGTTYRIVVKDHVDTTFALPAKMAEPAKVISVSPAAEKLPANLLRFYIHFDREMKPDQADDAIKLLDDKGVPVPFAFLDLGGEELWSNDGKRLTILLHPGRVKQELVPNKELGPVLRDGGKYTLAIAKSYRTADGATLSAEHRKTFTAGKEQASGLDPTKWKITAANDAVSIAFDAVMDRALLERVIKVDGIEGTVTASDKAWIFKPKQPLATGKYRIVIDDVLEDVCGNRIGAAFDAVLGKVGARQAKEPTVIPFTID